MERSLKLSSLLLLAWPQTACSDDIPAIPQPTSGETASSTSGVTTLVTDSITTSGVDTSTSASATGSTSDTTSSSSTTDPSTTDSGESSSDSGPACGDGSLDAGEECDGSELDGNDCIALGFLGGTLACDDDCTFDTSGCEGEDYPIDFCRLQFPGSIDEIEGTNVDVFGRVFSPGLTDMSGTNDPAPEMSGSVGYGPDGSDPSVDPTWVWTDGMPNAAYGPGAPSYEANNDEYTATLVVPSPPGTYDFAFRFSGDNGATFTYCDGEAAGSSDGYMPANAGQMTSLAPTGLYFSEHIEGSSNNKALEIYNPTPGDFDLNACEVRFYFNGSLAAGNVVPLSGTLPADGVFVFCDDDIDAAVFAPANCDVLAPGSFFNGDDALELSCGGIVQDIIGQVGNDPGIEWVSGGVSTLNQTIRRDCAVTMGDDDGADAFDPSAEWNSFALDDFSDLGQYMCP